MGEEMTRGCVLTFLYGRLHREREREERLREREREKENVLHHLRPTTERRSFCVRKKNF